MLTRSKCACYERHPGAVSLWGRGRRHSPFSQEDPPRASAASRMEELEAASSHCTVFDNQVRRRLDAARRALELAVQPDCRWVEVAELRWKAISSSFCRVDQIDATNEDLTIRSEPVVVLDFVRTANWPAATEWEPSYLRNHHPEHQAALRVGEASGEDVHVLLSDMIAYCWMKLLPGMRRHSTYGIIDLASVHLGFWMAIGHQAISSQNPTSWPSWVANGLRTGGLRLVRQARDATCTKIRSTRALGTSLCTARRGGR